MSPPGRDARYIYQSARSLRLKTRLRLDQGARTAFLLIHAVLRLFTLGKCKRSFTHCCRENVLKFEMLRMARIINQGAKSTSKQTLFFTHRRDFSMQFVWGKMQFFELGCMSSAVFFGVHSECIDTWLRRNSRGVRCEHFICGLTPQCLLTDALNKKISALSSYSGWLTWLDYLWFNCFTEISNMQVMWVQGRSLGICRM